MFLPLPDDFHAHLRQGELMPGYVRDLVAQFGRAIIMPNTVPAMTSAKAIADYKKQILEAAAPVRPDFEPLMTFKLNPNYTEQDLKDMMAVGVVAGKYYPAGVTTNSADGISDFEAVFPVVAMMEKLGLVLCVHGEEPGEFCLDREPAFIKRVETLAEKFPKLRIVFEHLSSAKSVEAVKRLPANVAATFTVHHLMTSAKPPSAETRSSSSVPIPPRTSRAKRNARAAPLAFTAHRSPSRFWYRNLTALAPSTSSQTLSQALVQTSTTSRARQSKSKLSRNRGLSQPL